MKDVSIKELKNTATEMRMKVIDMIWKAQSGHPGGSLSAAEFVTACYFKYMNIDPKNPRWEDRDRMVLSKGHVCPIQYACLGTLGYFPIEVLDTLRKEGSPLQGHPSHSSSEVSYRGFCWLWLQVFWYLVFPRKDIIRQKNSTQKNSQELQRKPSCRS